MDFYILYAISSLFLYVFHESSCFDADKPVWLERGIEVRARARKLNEFFPILCILVFIKRRKEAIKHVLKNMTTILTLHI